MERDAAPATEDRGRRAGTEDDWEGDDGRRRAYIDELPAALSHHHDVDRGENLRKIHAQSSAETSGLGDSLQRIHAHSSTETSGYAETIPSPTAAAYSPTGADSSSISGMADRQQRMRRQLTDSVTETVRHSNADSGPFPDPGPLQKKRAGRPALAGRARSIDSAANPDGPERPTTGHAMSGRKKRLEKDGVATARYEALASPDEGLPQPLFETPPSTRKWMRPDFLAEFAPPLSRENSAGSSLAGSVGSAGSNLFLGRSMQSTWLQWSHARRASFKQKIESIDERQKEEEKNRVTTPVLKARKESLMFVSTDVRQKGSPPPTDTRLMVCSQLPAEITSRSAARRKLQTTNEKDDVKLTVMQWRALVAFWEHPLFVRSRGGGILLSLVAFACGVFSIVTHDWSLFDGHPCYGQSHSGLWIICSYNPSNCSSILDRGFNLGPWQNSYKNASAEKRWDTCQEMSYWQWSVVATIAFSMSFALLAIGLSFCAVFAATLSRKIYYYHSAGEVCIICAASFAMSLVLYPFVTELERNLSSSHTYGHSYLVGWVGTLLFLVSSLFLCLDDIFRITFRVLGRCNLDGTQNSRI